MENDTIQVVKTCNLGIQMAVDLLEEVMEKVENSKLKEVIAQSLYRHLKLEKKSLDVLNEFDGESEDVDILVKTMFWMKTNWKLFDEEVDEKAADLITEGCGKGIASLFHVLNEYKNCSYEAQKLVHDLIREEEGLIEEVRPFL